MTSWIPAVIPSPDLLFQMLRTLCAGASIGSLALCKGWAPSLLLQAEGVAPCPLYMAAPLSQKLAEGVTGSSPMRDRMEAFIMQLQAPVIIASILHLISCALILSPTSVLISCLHFPSPTSVFVSCPHLLSSSHVLISCPCILSSSHVLISCRHLMSSTTGLVSCPHLVSSSPILI